MEFILYKTVSDNTALSKELTNGLTVSGTMRDGVSTLTPQFLIETDPRPYNYLYAFGKYYFINPDTVLYRNGIFEMSAREDVLYTFSEQIKQISGIVEYSENTANTYISDNRIKQYQYTKRQTKKIGQPFSYNSQIILQTIG